MRMNVNPRDKVHNLHGRLFQARIWREYAMAWDGMPKANGKAWNESILRKSREECIRLARVNLYLARRLNRRAS